jgi:hypothetical protein
MIRRIILKGRLMLPLSVLGVCFFVPMLDSGCCSRSSTSMWMDADEREENRVKDEARREKTNTRTRKVRISFDIAGRRITCNDSSDGDDDEEEATPGPLDRVGSTLSLADKSSAPETLVGAEELAEELAPWRKEQIELQEKNGVVSLSNDTLTGRAKEIYNLVNQSYQMKREAAAGKWAGGGAADELFKRRLQHDAAVMEEDAPASSDKDHQAAVASSTAAMAAAAGGGSVTSVSGSVSGGSNSKYVSGGSNSKHVSGGSNSKYAYQSKRRTGHERQQGRAQATERAEEQHGKIQVQTGRKGGAQGRMQGQEHVHGRGHGFGQEDCQQVECLQGEGEQGQG